MWLMKRNFSWLTQRRNIKLNIHASPKPFKCQRNLMLNLFTVHVKLRANALITVSVYAQLKKLQILVCGNECTVFPDNVSPLCIQTL